MLKHMLSKLRGLFRARTNRPSTTRSLALEPLGSRELCAVDIAYANGVTTIAGTNARDVIKVVPFTNAQGAPMHRFTVNGSTFFQEFPRGTEIRAGLLGGNDSLDAYDVTVKMIVNAGDGNDYVRSGRGNDVLYGNAGNDHLRGTAGNDTLHGGYGNDTLVGGIGNDWTNGNAGSDSVDMRDGNARANGDHNVNPEAIDTVLRDAFQNVAADARIVNNTTNEVRFTGGRVDMNATEMDFIFNLVINNTPKGQWRAGSGRINVNAYHFSIDAAVREDAGNLLFYNQLG